MCCAAAELAGSLESAGKVVDSAHLLECGGGVLMNAHKQLEMDISLVEAVQVRLKPCERSGGSKGSSSSIKASLLLILQWQTHAKQIHANELTCCNTVSVSCLLLLISARAAGQSSNNNTRWGMPAKPNQAVARTLTWPP